MGNQLESNIVYDAFLTILRAAIRGETANASALPKAAFPLQREDGKEALSGSTGEGSVSADSETALREYYAFWSALFSLARDHHVLPLIYDTAYKSGLLPGPDMGPLKNMTIRVVMQQTLRTQAFFKLYQNFAAKGLAPIVMKGIVCRELYPEPDQRPSSDEDLLIDPSDFREAHEILLESGLTCEKQEDLPNSSEELIEIQEITYVSSQLRIELHVSPFPEDSKAYGECNALFEGALDRTVTLEIDGLEVRTFAPADHLLYLICHAYKHFIHTGFGIRQVCDIVLFAERYKDEIDWADLRSRCETISIEVFTAALFQIGANHLGGAVPEAFSDIRTDETSLLLDILSGGVYGATDADRLHSSTITLDAVAARKQGRKRGGALASVFLPLSSMQEKYPYLKAQPWALPAAWVQRVFRYLLKKDGAASANPGASLKIGEDRVRILKEYHIVE